MSPSRLVVGGWCVVLGFHAICNRFVYDTCRVENFSALYMIRRSKEGVAFSSREAVLRS